MIMLGFMEWIILKLNLWLLELGKLITHQNFLKKKLKYCLSNGELIPFVQKPNKAKFIKSFKF